MFAALRTRLFIALSLTCAAAPGACKRDDGEASAVDNEGKKKKKKVTHSDDVRTWILDGSPKKPEPCGYVLFCTSQPAKLAFPSDASALHAHCGGTVKVPKEALLEGMHGEINAAFEANTTKEEREEKDPAACCYGYESEPCGKGRPLRDGASIVLADEIATAGWAGVDVEAAAREVEDVDGFVHSFRRLARLEHASVAAFAMVSLDLLSLGAPADLVEAAHVAALDEIRHARACWSLVASLTGEALGPAPLTIPARAPLDPERMVIETVIDGCVGETLGSLMFAELARRAPPALAKVYATIADEEARHAELAFCIVRFLVSRDPGLAGAARDAAMQAARAPSEGLLAQQIQREILDRGFRDVVWPVMLAAA